MIVLPPMTVDSTTLLSSSIPEPDASEASLWVSGNTYALNDKVYLTTTHKIYQCIIAGVSTTIPSTAIYDTVPMWTEIGSTNRYAMFDLYRNSRSTTTTGQILVVVKPSYRIDTIAILDLLNVTSISVVVQQNTTTIYSTTIATPSSTSLCTSIPPFYNTTATVTINGSTASTIGVGAVIFGVSEDIGFLQNKVKLDTINMSTVSRDIYGNANLVPRRNIPRISCTTLIASSATTRLTKLRSDLNAVPCLWVGLEEVADTYYEPTVVLGFYRAFSISLDNPIAATVTLELEEI